MRLSYQVRRWHEGNPLYPEGEAELVWLSLIFSETERHDHSGQDWGSAGLRIMILFVIPAIRKFDWCQSKAGEYLSQPMIKSNPKALFIPIVFLLGNLMSLVVQVPPLL